MDSTKHKLTEQAGLVLVTRLMVWGTFESILYDRNSRTGNDVVGLLSGAVFKREETGKLEILYFFSLWQAMGWAKVVFHSWSLICATLVNGQVCIKTSSANIAVRATQWYAIFMSPRTSHSSNSRPPLMYTLRQHLYYVYITTKKFL